MGQGHCDPLIGKYVEHLVIVRFAYDVSNILGSKKIVFLGVVGGPGRFKKVRAAERIMSSKDHVKRPS